MIAAVLIGVLAGMLAGMLGVGGGVLFVPALVILLDLSHVDAEATSLLAIIPVALVGAARQRHYGNVRVRESLLVGVLAIPGATGGVVVVNVLPERAIEVAFALLQLLIAGQMVQRFRRARGVKSDKL